MTEEMLEVPEELIPDSVPRLWGMLVLGTVMALSGGVIGYLIGMKRTKLKYEEILEREIQEAKEFYARRYKAGAFETPEQAAEMLGVEPPEVVETAFRQYRGDVQEPKQDPDVVVNVNVFGTDNTWDIEIEKSKREAQPDEPYVISKEEFQSGTSGYSQGSLSYFVEDDTLIDEQDQPLPDTESTVGEDNLNRFGHGSGDNRVVYIRNDRLEMEWEVVKHEGSYNKHVLGFDDHLEHADRRRPHRPPRRTDE